MDLGILRGKVIGESTQRSMRAQKQGFILTRKHIERRQFSYIELWLSTADGPCKVVTEAQQHVMFVAQQDAQQAQAYLQEHAIAFQIKDLALKTFEHHPVSGLYFNQSQAFFRARDLLGQRQITLYESDIRMADRYLMERFISAGVTVNGVVNANFSAPAAQNNKSIQLLDSKCKPAEFQPKLRVLSLDIECSLSSELYCIGLTSADYQHVLMIGAPEPCEQQITWVKEETELLDALAEAIQAFDPDIIVGWNLVNFDFRVLCQRAAQLGVRLRLGRDNSDAFYREPKAGSNQGFISIAGRVVLDGIDCLKAATYQFDNFTLENVAQQLLGIGKDTQDVDNRVDTINHDFHYNKLKLAAYNLQDCVLVEQIFEKTNLLDYMVLRSQLTGLELDRMGGSVAAFINLYLPKLHRAGYVSPNRPGDGGLASPGGYVMDSLPGLYKNVLVLDFKSLYPSIIRTFKIDPMGLIEGLLEPSSAVPGFKGAMFSREKHFLPDIIEQLWQQRDQAKLQKDAARSQAIKIIMNSFYGVLGSGGCPFYDTRLASSITMRGHDIMQVTAQWIHEAGYKVIYGDTDSTFVWLEDTEDPEKAIEIGKALEHDINARWREKLANELQLDCQLEIEFETLFERFLMPTIRGAETGSKKRYAGMKYVVNGQPQLIFKGLETVRSDWTMLAKNFQTKLYQMVFDNQDVTEFLLETVNSVRAGEKDNELVYRKRLRQSLHEYTKNVPPHVKAARIAETANQANGKPLQYAQKGWVQYVITLEGPQPIEYVTSTLDYEHYVDKQIRPIAEGILPFVGLSFDDITNQQMGLF